MNNDDTSTSNGGGQGRSSTLKQSSHGSTARSGGANEGTPGDNNSQITVWRRAKIVSLEFSLMFNKQIRLSEGGQGDMKHWRVSAPQTDGQDFLPPNIRILLSSQNFKKDTKKCCFIMSPWLYTVPVCRGQVSEGLVTNCVLLPGLDFVAMMSEWVSFLNTKFIDVKR